MNCVLTVKNGSQEKRLTAEVGETLLSALRGGGLRIDAPCGGGGRCGKCLVKASGALSEPTESENKLLDGKRELRLACMTELLGDACVELIETESVVLASGAGFGFSPDPAGEGEYGVAVDVGTTTVAAYLYRLSDGELLGTESGLNDQRGFGADVLSRAAYSMNEQEGLTQMQKAVCSQIDGYISSFCRRFSVDRESIKRICVAGNTIMEHIFCGLEVRTIAVAPFAPLDFFGRWRDELPPGIELKNAALYMPPAAAGYVGGDITAGMLAGGVYRDRDNYIFLDIGTNGEMVLHAGGKYLCAAAAAGPAFEGAEIECGVGGVEGAINRVSFEDGELVCGTIGDAPPVGVCGSGIIDALSIMLRLEAVDETGRLLDEDEAGEDALKHLNNGRFYLTSDVYISASDVRKIQLAKAAVAAGIDVLMDEAGVRAEDIKSLYLAGGFGSNLNRVTAADIGLFPAELRDKVVPLGNAAGSGAGAAMLSQEARHELDVIKERLEYIELSSDSRFTDAFIECMCF